MIRLNLFFRLNEFLRNFEQHPEWFWFSITGRLLNGSSKEDLENNNSFTNVLCLQITLIILRKKTRIEKKMGRPKFLNKNKN